MRVLRLIEFGSMAVDTLPVPSIGAHEVLIRTVATGICGSDIHGYTGHNGRRQIGQVMGHETVGRIAALGADVDGTRFSVGQPVTFNPVLPCGKCEHSASGDWQRCPDRKIIGVDADLIGAFAEHIPVPADNVVPLDPGVPILHGALAEPLAVALYAARRADVKAGDRVLVVGGGPIGQSCVLAAFRLGASEVLVSELDPARRALCETLGASTLDPGAAESLEAGVLERFGDPADVAIDAVGISATVSDVLAATRLGGTVCLVGMGSPELTIEAYRVSVAERSLVGSFTYPAQGFRDAVGWLAEIPEHARAALISEVVPMEGAQEAFTALSQHQGPAGKILVLLDDEG